ncbi:MAG: hypothetical protein ACREFO_06825 [Acetobacteraceae bacterium]
MGGRELRTRFEDPGHDPGEDEIAAAATLRAKEPVEADLARGDESGSDVAVRQRAGDGEGVALRGDDDTTPRHAAQAFAIRGRPLRKVAELNKAFAMEDLERTTACNLEPYPLFRAVSLESSAIPVNVCRSDWQPSAPASAACRWSRRRPNWRESSTQP